MAQTGVVSIHGRDYKTVALRVSEFREKHAIEDGWAIITEELAAPADCVKVVASILNPDGRQVATGLAEEKRGATQINRTSALENCETSAIGRALAAAGFGGSEYASANEVENAVHQQAQPDPQEPSQPPKGENESFLDALDGLKARALVALDIIGEFPDASTEMHKRFTTMLGNHGVEKPLEIDGKPKRLTFYRDWEASVEAMEELAFEKQQPAEDAG